MNAPQDSVAINGRAAKVLIVDDHPIVRQGLADLVDQEENLTVCGQAGDPGEALAAIKQLSPDMVTIDISLKESSGIELIKDIQNQYPDLPLLAISMHEESLFAERALRAGARGYIMKREATKKVITAIRKVLKGDIYLSEAMATKVLSKVLSGEKPFASPIDRLTDRELEVFTLLGEGRTTRQVAEQLHLSIKTIETHRAHIKEKLNLADANELMRHAFQWVSDQRKK